MTSTPEQKKQDKTNFLWLFMSLFLLGFLFLGGTYLFVHLQKVDSIQEPINNQTATTQNEIHTLQNKLDMIQPKNIQKDFTQINQEMKNL